MSNPALDQLKSMFLNNRVVDVVNAGPGQPLVFVFNHSGLVAVSGNFRLDIKHVDNPDVVDVEVKNLGV